ncbi:MAG TPA: hypothetical protein VFU88_07085 [Ktedonobacterales bacterium]|nr:hypothetical protein [Ktedonobacterales bacterium]
MQINQNRAQRAAPLAINVLVSGLQCPRDIAWSPDGQEIAVLGYGQGCPGATEQELAGLHTAGPLTFYTGQLLQTPGLINLYDTRNGRLLSQIHPDDAILPLITVPPAVEAKLATIGLSARRYLGVNYAHVLWSPNGHRMAVSFSIFVITALAHPDGSTMAQPAGNVMDGIVLYDSAGHNPQVAMRQVDQNQPATTVWGVEGSAPVALAGQAAAGPSPFASLPPALSYAWASNGAFTPQEPLSSSPPATPASLTAIGSLRGGQVLSLWQAGIVFSGLPPVQGGQADLRAPWLATDATAWSPDGRYLAERVAIAGLLVAPDLPAPNPAKLMPYGWAQAPLIPIRDAGLRKALSLPGFATFGEPGVLVAWRPDGRLLAVNASTPDHAVLLFDCATGRQVASLPPPGGPNQGPFLENQPNALRWSPDGKQLAIFDTELAQITLWSGSLLPR